jgi:hypothetical protein
MQRSLPGCAEREGTSGIDALHGHQARRQVNGVLALALGTVRSKVKGLLWGSSELEAD